MSYSPIGMKFTTRSRNAISFLIDLGTRPDKAPCSLSDFCGRFKLSVKYMSTLVIPLRKHKIVSSVLGPHGGYFLQRAPETLSILEIVEIMDGPFHFCDCITDPESCLMRDICYSVPVWESIDGKIRSVLDSFTLLHLVERYPTVSNSSATSGATRKRRGK